jgi:lysophospholipase L1-like esterase
MIEPGVKIIDLYALTHSDWQKGIHFSDDGYRQMAALITDSIAPVLCLGDSICGGWSKYIACETPSVNCQSTPYALAHLVEWTHGKRYDAIVFNFGLWDIKQHVSIEEYKRNLGLIIDCLKADRIYFCTTTPGREGEDKGRTPQKVEEYNRAALEVMRARGVKIIDLHALCLKHHQPGDDWRVGIHYSEEGYQQMAHYIKHVIEASEQKGTRR